MNPPPSKTGTGLECHPRTASSPGLSRLLALLATPVDPLSPRASRAPPCLKRPTYPVSRSREHNFR